MKILIFGTGGVGGCFGGRLAASGEDVTFIARGEHLRALREHGLRIESGRAKGVDLPAGAAENQLKFTDSLPHDMISSLLGDRNRGRRLKLPWPSDAVVRLGEQLGIATPANRFVYAALKLHADGRTAGVPKPPT